MGLRKAASILVWAASCAAVAEPALEVSWNVSAGVRHRTLTEWSAGGSKLLTEEGVLPRLQLSALSELPSGPAVAVDVGATLGRLDYQGQTQAGLPAATASRHRDLDLAFRLRPLPSAPWGEAWLSVGWLQIRRAITSSPSAGGIDEMSSLVLPGIGWRTRAFPLGNTDDAKVFVEVQWRTSSHHRLAVDYLGVFDNSRFGAGRRNEATLRLVAAGANSWQGSVEWSRTRQHASASYPLYRAGAVVASVRHPRLHIDDVGFSLTRRF